MAGRALPEGGTNTDTCLILARLESDLGHTEESERWACKATGLDSKRADAEVFLARLLIRQDRMEEAVVCLRQAIRLDNSLTSADRLLGMALEREGNAKEAEDALKEALRHNAGDAEAGFVLGRLLLDQGRTQEAIACLEKACRSDPGSASGFYVLYQAQDKAGDTAAAQESLHTFQKLKDKERIRTAAFEAGQSDERKLRESAAEFHNGMAAVLQRTGQPALAEAHLHQGALVAPEEPLAFQRLAALCVKTGRLREAEGYFATLAKLQPEEPSYGVNRGTLLLQLNDYPGAVSEFKRVLQIQPNQTDALNNLARFYLSHRQQVPDALEMSQRLVDHQPTAANYDLLGWALYLNGRTNQALEACKQALRRDPDNAAYLERRRRLEQAVGTTH